MTPYEQIDFIFFFIKERTQYGGSIGRANVLDRVEKTPEININVSLALEILIRLEEDGFIRKLDHGAMIQPTYRVTIDGILFNGYSETQTTQDLQKAQLVLLEKQNRLLQIRTFWLTVVLAFGTLVSASKDLIDMSGKDYVDVLSLIVLLIVFLVGILIGTLSLLIRQEYLSQRNKS